MSTALYGLLMLSCILGALWCAGRADELHPSSPRKSLALETCAAAAALGALVVLVAWVGL